MPPPQRVLLADSLAPEGIGILEAEGALQVEDLSGRPRSELKKALEGAVGLLVRSGTRVDADLIAAGESLRVIGRAGVGLDNIDVDAATRRGIAVLNAPAGNTVSTAELTFALLLSAARRIPAADRSVRDGTWDRTAFRGSQLEGKTLGVIGAGRIGTEVILRARAFGMRVLVADPYLGPERAADLSVELLEIEELLPQADFVTLHVPLTRETAGLLDEARIDMLKPSTVLVNAARGGIVDEAALAAALHDGRLAGAALDVFEREPLPSDHPLRGAPNLVLTPHLGAATDDAQLRVAVEIAEAVRAALVHGEYRGAVNMPPSLPRDRERLRPVLDLAERLGRVGAALFGGGFDRLSIRYGGEVERGLRLLASAVLIGLLRDRIEAPLNLINALTVARERGIDVSRARMREASGYRSLLEVSLEAEGRSRTVRGGIDGDGRLRLLRLDGYHIDVTPGGILLIVRNADVPGVIGEVGTRLGTAGVNIAEFHQVRDLETREALAVLVLDESPGSDLLQSLQEIPPIHYVTEIRLD